jgi:ribosomal protein L24E
MRILATCLCGYDIEHDDDYIEIQHDNSNVHLCSWKCSELYIKQNMAYMEVMN